jgi:hypothetical protein
MDICLSNTEEIVLGARSLEAPAALIISTNFTGLVVNIFDKLESQYSRAFDTFD